MWVCFCVAICRNALKSLALSLVSPLAEIYTGIKIINQTERERRTSCSCAKTHSILREHHVLHARCSHMGCCSSSEQHIISSSMQALYSQGAIWSGTPLARDVLCSVGFWKSSSCRGLARALDRQREQYAVRLSLSERVRCENASQNTHNIWTPKLLRPYTYMLYATGAFSFKHKPTRSCLDTFTIDTAYFWTTFAVCCWTHPNETFQVASATPDFMPHIAQAHGIESASWARTVDRSIR